MTLWGGSEPEPPDPTFWELNRSFGFDRRLLNEEVAASRAWVSALLQCDALKADEARRLDEALVGIRERAAEDPRYLELDVEDVHSFVETRLRESVASLAGQVRLARSRNEQTATTLRLWSRAAIDRLRDGTKGLVDALVDQGLAASDAVMPGSTHGLPAEPITFGHLMAAHAWVLVRDDARLAGARVRCDESPLGSGALAGTALPLDREALARELGFRAAGANALDGVMSRDAAVELVSACALAMTSLSRLAADLITLSAPDEELVSLPAAFTTGSSLMPNKRNPDALELIRAKAARVAGRLVAILELTRGLTAGYHKDMQEDKEAVFEACDETQRALTVMAGVVRGLSIDRKKMLGRAGDENLMSGQLAVALSVAGQPFDVAHQVVTDAVKEARASSRTLREVMAASLETHAPELKDRLDSLLDPVHAVGSRVAVGGTAPERVRESLERARARLAAQQAI